MGTNHETTAPHLRPWPASFRRSKAVLGYKIPKRTHQSAIFRAEWRNKPVKRETVRTSEPTGGGDLHSCNPPCPTPFQVVFWFFTMELKSVRLEIPDGGNIIVGQTHFIKSVEDIYEAIVNTVPQMKFGVAFNEASGPCLTRADGNDPDLKALAIRNATALAAGHVFVVVMREGYPINVLGRIKDVPEVCSIFCATANPVEVIVAETPQGRGILGVVDGEPPKGVETEQDAAARVQFLRKIGYKR